LPPCARPLRDCGNRGGRPFGERPSPHHPLRLFRRSFLRGGVGEAADQNPSSFGVGILAHEVATARLSELVASWIALALASTSAHKGDHLGGLPLSSLQKGSRLPPLAALPSQAS